MKTNLTMVSKSANKFLNDRGIVLFTDSKIDSNSRILSMPDSENRPSRKVDNTRHDAVYIENGQPAYSGDLLAASIFT